MPLAKFQPAPAPAPRARRAASRPIPRRHDTPDRSAQRAEARAAVLAALVDHCPEALEELRASVPTNDEELIAKCRQCFGETFDISDARFGLDAFMYDSTVVAPWTQRHHLEAKWIAEWLMAVVGLWARQPLPRECAEPPRSFFPKFLRHHISAEVEDERFKPVNRQEILYYALLEAEPPDPFSLSPQPWRESKDEFMARAGEQYDAATEKYGLVPRSEARALALHAKWFIQHQVLAQSFAAIADGEAAGGERDDSSIRQAVTKLAEIVEIRLRPAPGRTRD